MTRPDTAHRRPHPGRPAPILVACLVALAGTTGSHAAAQQAPGPEPLTSDRPGLGDGAGTLLQGAIQIEAGMALLRRGTTGAAFGQGLVRWGLRSFEVRLYPNSVVVDGGNAELQDPGIGVKVPLGSGAPPLAVVAGTTLPIGTGSASAGDPTLFATGVWETALGPRVGLAVNLGYGASVEDLGGGTASFLLTPSLPIAAAPGLSAYGGVAVFAGPSDDVLLEAGLARVVGLDAQVDLNAGLSLGDGTSFVGVGFSRRWR